MSATPIPRRPRRGRTFWARMVAEHAQSNLSARAFCSKRNLGLSTFVRWKRKLSVALPPVPAFVELPVAPSTRPESRSGWEVELELAEGVRLRVRRL